MDNQLMVSVIVPVYNVEKYLDKCIDSIVNQTYKNLEIILVDDGSTDDSGKICDDWKIKDNRITVYHKKNGGLSDARNYGLDRCKGEYISFVDSDDYIDKNMLLELYNRIVIDDSDMSICNITYVDEKYVDNEKQFKPIKNEILTKKKYFNKQFEKYFWCYVVACNKLYKKELFENLRYDYGKIHEDEYIIHKIIDHCKNISCVSNSLYYYLQRNDSIMHKEFSVKRLNYIDALYNRYLYFINKEYYSLALLTMQNSFDFLLGKVLNNNEFIKSNKCDVNKSVKLLRIMYNKSININYDLKRKLIYGLICYNYKLFNIFVKTKNKAPIYKELCKIMRKIKKPNTVILTFTPEHGNLGDHAIALASMRLLKDYNVVEITYDEINKLIEYDRFIKTLKNVPIVINGGGNLGTLWFDVEELYRKILSTFKNNNIITLPQTIFYEDSDFGRQEFEKSKQLYNSCPNLTLYAREKISYDIMKNAYNNVYLCPDMVLSYKFDEDVLPVDNQIVFSLRQDLEKTRENNIDKSLFKLFSEKLGKDIVCADMVLDHRINKEQRKSEVENQMKLFAESEYIVTDRLHAMIFSAIVGTPCAVINSKSPKVRGVYDYVFKNNERIIFTDSIEEINNHFEKYCGKKYTFKNNSLKGEYQQIIDTINKCLKRK